MCYAKRSSVAFHHPPPHSLSRVTVTVYCMSELATEQKTADDQPASSPPPEPVESTAAAEPATTIEASSPPPAQAQPDT